MIKECLNKLQNIWLCLCWNVSCPRFQPFFVQFFTANLSPIVLPFLQSHLFLLLVFFQFSPQIWFLPFSPHIWSLYIIIAYTPPIFSYISSHFLTNNCRPLKKHLKNCLLPFCSFLGSISSSVFIFVLGVHFCWLIFDICTLPDSEGPHRVIKHIMQGNNKYCHLVKLAQFKLQKTCKFFVSKQKYFMKTCMQMPKEDITLQNSKGGIIVL